MLKIGYPFSSLHKWKLTIQKIGDETSILVKGGADVLLQLCDFYNDDNDHIPMNNIFLDEINQIINSYAKDGKRYVTIFIFIIILSYTHMNFSFTIKE